MSSAINSVPPNKSVRSQYATILPLGLSCAKSPIGDRCSLSGVSDARTGVKNLASKYNLRGCILIALVVFYS